MPASPMITPEGLIDLASHLGEPGEKEYRRLVRSLRMAQGSFFLFPIESDFPNRLRNALLTQLRADLNADGLHLRIAELTREQWDVFATPELETPVTESDVMALVGLEETPGIVPEAGAKPSRPPALALLNSARETLHRCIPAPMLVWCPPYVYTALMEHAPDFFDHYTGLFQFMDAVPEAEPTAQFQFSDLPMPERTLNQDGRMGRRAALEFYEELVANNPGPTPNRARALIGLANALEEFRGLGYTDRLVHARHAAQEALSLLSPEQDAYEWGRGHNLLGLILLRLPVGNQVDNLHHAIACFRSALTVYTQTIFPVDWAMTQSNLGVAYSELQDENQDENLNSAIAYSEAALTVYTKANHPIEWAGALNNLGTTYGQLSTGDRNINLLKSINYLEKTLEVYTENNHPIDWSMVQNNLGVAYCQLRSGDKSQNLRSAISCFEAAFRVRTKTSLPLDWATTQNNVGAAYLNLSTGDQDENLYRAIDSFKAVLTVHTKDNFPLEWAKTQQNLGVALRVRDDKLGAAKAFQYAIDGYLAAGHEQDARKVDAMKKGLSLSS